MLCDDEKQTCAELEEMILTYARKKKTKIETGVFYTGETLLSYLAEHPEVSILFLDIERPQKDGVEIGKILREELLTAGAWLIGMNGMLLVVTRDVIYFENEILGFVFLEQAAMFGCFLWKGIRLRKQGQQSQSLYQFEMSALPLKYGVF